MKNLREVLRLRLLRQPYRWQRATMYLVFAWYLLVTYMGIELDPLIFPGDFAEMACLSLFAGAPWLFLCLIQEFQRPMGLVEAYAYVYLLVGSNLLTWYLLLRLAGFVCDRIRGEER